MAITRDVVVSQLIRVTVDETKFTPEFMEEFRRSFFPYYIIEEHLEHLAQLAARRVIEPYKGSKEFIEGYGPANEMGISVEFLSQEEELL